MIYNIENPYIKEAIKSDPKEDGIVLSDQFLDHVEDKTYGIWTEGSEINLSDISNKYNEIAKIDACEHVFCPTEFCKQIIIERILYFLPEDEIKRLSKKITPTGLPFDYYKYRNMTSIEDGAIKEKENIIVYSDDFSVENSSHIFINSIQALSMYVENFEDYTIVIGSEPNKKWPAALLASFKKNYNVEVVEDYYKYLAKAKLWVTTKIEANFSFKCLEALSMGCTTIAPNSACYPEILEQNNALLYNDLDDFLDKIEKGMEQPQSTSVLRGYVEPYSRVLQNWLNIMKGYL